MYSVLVTTMMSLGTTTPACDWFGGTGCTGCNGSASTNSWFGGGGFLGLGLFSGYGSSSCHGCHGASVGSYSVPMTYGAGCPSCGATAMPAMPGEAFPPSAAMPMPGGTILPPAGLGEMTRPPAGLGETAAPPMALGEPTTGANQAKLLVTLPADARLYAEKQIIQLTGDVRVFVTPPLEPGRTYYYELTIEVDRGGQTRRETKTVELQAGKVTRVAFPDPA